MTDPAGQRGVLGKRLRFGSWLLFLRFGMAGLLNAAFGYAAFAVLLLAGTGTGVALVAAMAAGVVFNFQTSKRLVFRSKGRALRFVAVYGFVLAMNWAALRGLGAIGVSALVGQALLVLPAAAMSFLGQKMFVFHPLAGQP
jgi:putative flippase GtrA